jgi:hypothetical protein
VVASHVCVSFETQRNKRSIDLVAKFKILRWLRHVFQESFEFGLWKTKWSEKS